MKVNWKEGKDEYYQISECGNYTLSASKLKNKWIYVLWDANEKQTLGRFQTAKQAKEFANDRTE